MKIGIACYPTFGGSGMVASELALALARRGHGVHVMSYARPPRLAEEGPSFSTSGEVSEVMFHEVRVLQYPLFEYPPYSLALATKMVEVVRKYDLDILHVHYAVPNAISAILARQIVAPRPLSVVCTLHGTDVTLVGNDPSYLETTRFSLHQSDAVTAVSGWLKKRTREQLGEALPIEVVPNFVDAERFSSGRSTREPNAPPFRLVHISNFRPVKRAGDLVEILWCLHQRGLSCELVLVGDGPELAPTLAAAEQRGLGTRVHARGEITRVEDVLSEADLFLLPSEQESFGLAALEAMAAGVPVIATFGSGLAEVVPHGEAGLLYAVGDTAGMAAGAESLLLDPPRRHRFAEQALIQARKFTLHAAVDLYEGVYETTLARRLVTAG